MQLPKACTGCDISKSKLLFLHMESNQFVPIQIISFFCRVKMSIKNRKKIFQINFIKSQILLLLGKLTFKIIKVKIIQNLLLHLIKFTLKTKTLFLLIGLCCIHWRRSMFLISDLTELLIVQN